MRLNSGTPLSTCQQEGRDQREEGSHTRDFPEYNWKGLNNEEDVVPYELIASMTSLVCRSS